MRKAILIIITLGFILVGFAFYFAKLSNNLIEQVNRKEEAKAAYNSKEVLKLENRIKQLQQSNDKQYHYRTLQELNQVDFVRVNNCVKSYLSEYKMSNSCKDHITDILIDDYGELGFIKSVIGYSLNYYSFTVDYSFPKSLFDAKAPLSSKLILHFLNRLRNPVALQEKFNTYKNHFYNRIPKSIYNKVFDVYVSKLIKTYEEINSQEDKEAYFKEIYFKAESQNLHSKYWETTFWKRRALEKNDTVIYGILNDIQNYYKAQ